MATVDIRPFEDDDAPAIARLLVVAAFQATRTVRMDLITSSDADGFYEAFAHERMSGFRIYPGA